MSAEASGAGRRLTGEEEQRAAEMFGAGATDSQVADALRVGRSTANRLRHRVGKPDTSAGAELTTGEDTPAPDLTLRGSPSPGFVLRRQRDVQEELVGSLEGREAASRSAIEQLEAERLQAFDEGRVDVGLRERARNAADEAQDWAQAADRARVKLAQIDEEIGVLLARDALAAAEAELARTIGSRDVVYARSGDRQRAAVEAVWAAAVDFAAVPADEQAADGAVAQALSAVTQLCAQLGVPVPAVPVAAPSWLPLPGGAQAGPQLALTRAMYQARRGDVGAVAELLGAAGGWLPPAPPTEDELAERREIAEARQRELEREQAKADAGIGWQEPGVVTDLDEFGNALRPDPPELRRSPTDAYPGTPPSTAYGLPFRGW